LIQRLKNFILFYRQFRDDILYISTECFNRGSRALRARERRGDSRTALCHFRHGPVELRRNGKLLRLRDGEAIYDRPGDSVCNSGTTDRRAQSVVACAFL
jgi:hypothetical protein